MEGTSTHTNLYILLNEHKYCLSEATERIKVKMLIIGFQLGGFDGQYEKVYETYQTY